MDSAGKVPHMFPDEKLGDLDELNRSDGWMRATAPSGAAAYEGIKMWRDTAGSSSWDPEPPQDEADSSSRSEEKTDG